MYRQTRNNQWCTEINNGHLFLPQKSGGLKCHDTDPANFSEYLYQPEKDANAEKIHHREDQNHLLKRIISHLHEG